VVNSRWGVRFQHRTSQIARPAKSRCVGFGPRSIRQKRFQSRTPKRPGSPCLSGPARGSTRSN